MNVVALRPQPVENRIPAVIDAGIARLELFDDMRLAEPHWRALECTPALATPYQRYDFLALWQRHVGEAVGMMPLIAVGFNAAETPLFLWPFGIRLIGGQRVAEFLGGKHANFNMGLWRRETASKIGADDLNAIFRRLAYRVDIVKLINQPLTWDGTTNPFALLPQQRSANSGYSCALVPDFAALLRARTNAPTRKKMRKKERMLAGYGAVRFARADNADEVRRLLNAFFKQKAARMRMLGIPDVFAAPRVRRFVEAAATEHGHGGAPPIELYALSVDDIIVATMGGIVGGGRFCAMFNSIGEGRFAVESPGEQLIVNLVRQCCERGFTTFDLGIGEARYKRLFCGDIEPLFDTYLPLTAGGRVIAFALAVGGAIKRAIKRRTILWSMVRAARRLRARLSPAL